MKDVDYTPVSFADCSSEITQAACIAVRADESGGSIPSSIDELIERYKKEDPGVFSIGGTFGIDSSVFQLELSDVYVSVVGILNDAGVRDGKLLSLQGIAYFRVARIFTISAALIGAYDASALAEPLELFNRKPETDAEREEALRTRNKFFDLTGDTIRRYELAGDAKENNGLYFLIDANGNVAEKQYVFTAIGLLDLDWLKKIGVNCGLKFAAMGAYNSFANAWELGFGARFTVPSGTEWLGVGRVGFKSGRINTIAVEVRGEIPIGPVIFTQIKMGVSGMADKVQTYSPGLGAAFGPQISIGDLSSKFAKMLGLKTGKFRVAEVGASGDIASDFQDVNLSVEGKLFGLLEIKGGWKRENGNYNEISLSVGTKNSSTFNFQISGAVGWSDTQLTVKGMLDGHFKWDFTALGIAWVGVDVGGGVSVVYNATNLRKTLSIAANGRAKVKVGFVKFGVNVANSWFIDLSSRGAAYTCSNTQLEESASGGKRSLRAVVVEDEPPEGISGDKIGSYSWVSTELAEEGRTYITVAAQYSLTDMEWVLYAPDGSVYTSEDLDKPVGVKKISYSQLELTVDNAVRGDWKLDVFGSDNRNGEVCIFTEAGDPVETGVRIVSVDKKSVTVEYQAHATGEHYLAALYMQRADRPDDEYEGTIIDYLEATEGDEYRRATFDLPESVQGGMYKFYVMAQSTNCAEIAWSDKTDPVEILVRTASLKVTDFRIEFRTEDPLMANVYCTVTNAGTEHSGIFPVELLLGDSEIGTDDDQVIASTKTSLDAGASRELQLTGFIPREYVGKQAVMSVLLDRGNAVDEGIFEEDNIAMKTIAPTVLSEGAGKILTWTAVEGASTYDLEYAVEGDWDDSAVLRGFTGNAVRLDLAAGHYTFRVTARDTEGRPLPSAVEEWDEAILFSSAFSLAIVPGAGPVSTEQFELMDGLYDWMSIDLGDFTGTLTLNQVEGTFREYDDLKMTAEVIDGEVTGGSVITGLLLDNGLYYFTATGTGTAAPGAGLSFSIMGEPFPNLGPERGVVSLPDCVDSRGVYQEMLEGWVGAFDGQDSWEYLLEDAGELTLGVDAPESLTGVLVVELYAQTVTNGQYQCVKTLSVDASTPAGVILDNFLVTNNFYVRVGALDNGAGGHNTEYSLDLTFTAFDDPGVEEGQRTIFVGEEAVQVDGWVGYRKTSDTYLLTVDSDCAGRYDFSLTGDAQEATLNVRSISGKLVKSAVLNAGGNILISDLDLYTGDYLVEIDSRNDVRIENNTRYTLTVARNESFELISATDSAEVDHAEQGEKLLFALEVPESGIYDVTELQEAGLTVWFQETDADGRLGASKLRPEWVELEWDVPGYMTVCNSTSAWGDTIIGLDSEKHKFVLSAAPALDV